MSRQTTADKRTPTAEAKAAEIEEFTDEQFDSVMIDGRETFAKMAAEAVQSAKAGKVRKFPA